MGSASRDEPTCCIGVVVLLYLGLLVLGIMMLITITSQHSPHFKLESASVSINATSNTTISPDQVLAEWSIGFSVENPNVLNAIGFKDLTLSVKSPLGSTTPATFPDFQKLSRKTRSFDAVVRGPLPRLNTTNSFVLNFDVNLQTKIRFLNWMRVGHKFRSRKVTCSLLKIELTPFQTNGVRLGNPVMCCDLNEYGCLS